MLGVPLAATDAHLAVDEALKTTMLCAVEERPRAVKVVVDAKGERLVADRTLQEGPSLAEDFTEVAGILEASVPCLVLVRLQGADDSKRAPGCSELDYAMIAWTPSDSPVKLRMLCASSRKTLRNEFSDLRFVEYNAAERDEVALSQFLESTRELTESDRHAAMTQEELDAEEVRRQVAQEQASGPRMLAGLVALRAQVSGSFETAVGQLLADGGSAVLGRLSGPTGEELGGELLEGAGSSASCLRGRLPATEPCYVLLRPSGEERLLLLSWLPEDAGVKARMKCSTFKASVLESVRGLAGGWPLAQAEVTSEEDLEDDLAATASVAPASLAPPDSGSAEATAKPPAPGARPVPPGGVALPGLGGGVALPGLGGLARRQQGPQGPQDPQAPQAPEAPQVPEAPQAQQAPQAPEAPEVPEAPQAQQAPQAPEAPEAQQAPEAPQEQQALQAQQVPQAPQAPQAPQGQPEAEGQTTVAGALASEGCREGTAVGPASGEELKRPKLEKVAAAGAQEESPAKSRKEEPAREPLAAARAQEESPAKSRQEVQADGGLGRGEQGGPAQEPAREPPAGANAAFLTLQELQDASVWKPRGIDPTARETYLSEAEFRTLFGLEKDAFARLPKWKRDQKKKEHGLF